MMRRGLRRIAFLHKEIVTIHAAALILGGAGLASRLLGVVRDHLLAARFGAGRELDIYNAAFNIPDFMSVLFLLGGASAAILPMFQEYLGRDREKAREFISVLAVLFFLASSAACIAAFFASPFLMRFVVPGFGADDQALTASLTRLMLISPILLGLSGIFSVVIQSCQRFFVYALAPVLYNGGIVAGIIFLVPRFGVMGLAGGVVIGAFLHMGLQAWSVALLGFPPRFFRSLAHLTALVASFGASIRAVALTALPRVVSVSLVQITLLILDAIGSTLSRGSIAVLGLAQNLYFVPVGIFGVSYATAIFPRLAAAAAVRRGEDFFRELFSGIRSIFLWVAPSAALFIVLRAHIVRLALGGRAFTWEDTRLTAAVLAALAVAMIAASLQTLLVRGFYALGNTWIPLAVNVAASLFSIALAFFLTRMLATASPLGRGLTAIFRISDLPHPEVLGLGLGFAAGLTLDVLMLAVMLVAHARKIFGGAGGAGGREIMKIIAAAFAAGFAAYAVRANFSEILPLITFARVFVQGAGAAAAGCAAYIAALMLMRSEDIAWMRRVAVRGIFSLRMLPKEWDGEQRE